MISDHIFINYRMQVIPIEDKCSPITWCNYFDDEFGFISLL